MVGVRKKVRTFVTSRARQMGCQMGGDAGEKRENKSLTTK